MIYTFLLVFLLAFLLQFIDASAGMGFGTLTPLLILFGFPPLESISTVLISSAVLSLFAGSLHHGFDNIDFLKDKNIKIIVLLSGLGILAVLAGVFVAVRIPEYALDSYIGLLIIAIGISILFKRAGKAFSWKRLTFFGILASFNKGISGGGYGPVLAGGQITSGVDSKHAVAITALSEGIVSSIGFLAYMILNGLSSVDWILVIFVIIAGIFATPASVYFVKKFHPKNMRYLVAAISILVGFLMLIKAFAILY